MISRQIIRPIISTAIRHKASKNIPKCVSISLRFFSNFKYRDLVSMQKDSVEKFRYSPFLGTRVGENFQWITYGDFDVSVQRFRNVLTHHKIGRGDKVALISNNRVEWAVIKYAVIGVGAQLVPMYEVQSEKDYKYIIENSEAKLLIVANEKLREKTADMVGKVGYLQSLICLDCADDALYSYARWMASVTNEPPQLALPDLQPDEPVVIIYTSGTTGTPKGVQLSHRNILAVVEATDHKYGSFQSSMGEQRGSVAFLPWAHVYGMVNELHNSLLSGWKLALSNREQLLENIKLAKPNMIVGVPAFYNRVYDVVVKNIATETGLKKTLIATALRIARQRNARLEAGESVGFFLNLQFSIADKLVLSKIRAKIGENIRGFTSGGAAMSLPVLHFFEDIGLPVLEGYGLTETAPVIAANAPPPGPRRLGTVGTANLGVDIRIVDPDSLQELPPGVDGEVAVSGDNVMLGYYKNPAANEEVFFTLDGKRFFRTGDMGHMLDGKFLKLTGRIKEQYKLSNSKFVVPTPLESAMERSPFVLQSMVYGNNKTHNVVLIVPDIEGVKEELRKRNEKAAADAEPVALIAREDVLQFIAADLGRIGAGMKSYERPKRMAVIAEPFSQLNQMLTPKMSIRRNMILKVYATLVDGMYAGTHGTDIAYEDSKEKK